MSIGTFLNGRTPVQLRGLLWLSLSETGNVLTQSNTDDSGGGVTQAWTTGSDIPCRIDPLSAGPQRITGGQIDERSTHLVTVPPGTTVSTGNQFAIDGRGTFEITAVRSQTAESAHFFEVIAAS